jgi:hypothetical protein
MIFRPEVAARNEAPHARPKPSKRRARLHIAEDSDGMTREIRRPDDVPRCL